MRMSEILGHEKDFMAYDRINVLKRCSGKKGKGDAFELKSAKVAARNLLPLLVENYDKVVLMGQNVARAFDMKGRHFEKMRLGRAEFMCFPHPSGINLWWNDAAKVRSGKKRLRNFLWKKVKKL